MDGLVAFVPARLDEWARDPARAREVEALRRVLEDLDLTYPDEEHLLKLLAAIWRDHPDYDPGWAP